MPRRKKTNPEDPAQEGNAGAKAPDSFSMDKAKELFQIDDEVSLRILWKLYHNILRSTSPSAASNMARVVLEYRLGKPFQQSGPPKKPIDQIDIRFSNVLEEEESGANDSLPSYSIEVEPTETEVEE